MEWDAECVQIANRAGSMCWLHEEAAKIYEKRDTVCSTLVNIGTSLLGGIAITFLAASDPAKLYIILFQVATLGLGISGMVVNSFAWRTKATKHRVLVGKNDYLFSQIRKELRKPISGRTSSKHFHENIIDLESEVRQEGGSLTIPSQVYIKYKELFAEVALPLQELVVIAIEKTFPEESNSIVSTPKIPPMTNQFELQRYTVNQL